jgi:hypothetical protein
MPMNAVSGPAKSLSGCSAVRPVASLQKLIKENIWDVSPNSSLLNRLESINILQEYRKCTPNYVGFILRNSFVISKKTTKSGKRFR